MVESFDQVHLNFSPESLQLLNVCLAFIMFGIALELKITSFKALLKKPKPIIIGAISQLFLLPLLTFLLINILQPHPSFALGMIMVAACPGGNVSNFFSLLAKGNTELSVSLTAVGTLSAIVFTPLNFTFWGGLYAPTAALMSDISVDTMEIFKTVLLLLAIPLALGMLVGHYFPKLVAKTGKPLRILSMLFLAGFIVVAFIK
ncbi:MAG: bile acid:sodium symporter family protein, partial [Chitinophagales bacterium]